MNAGVCVFALMAATFLPASPPLKPVQVPVRGIAPRQLTRAEFIESLERSFRRFDTQARGYFTAANLSLPGYAPPSSPPVPYFQWQAQAPFRCVDANQDGRISRAEYVGYGARAFEAAARSSVVDNWNLSPLRRALTSHANCK
jgi:hypothetical protein